MSRFFYLTSNTQPSLNSFYLSFLYKYPYQNNNCYRLQKFKNTIKQTSFKEKTIHKKQLKNKLYDNMIKNSIYFFTTCFFKCFFLFMSKIILVLCNRLHF